MIEYIIFFGMFLLCVILYWLYEKKPKESFVVDPERHKCDSSIELRLYDALKARGEYIRTQVPCGRYSIDIALPAYYIAIECDGKAYHSTPEQKAHDRRKNTYLKKNGWKVLRFSGKRIYNDLNGIIKQIEKEKGG